MCLLRLAAAVLIAVTIAAPSAAQVVQAPSAADQLLAARATYYTLTAKGVKSFHCDVDVDWQNMLTRFSGKTIPDDSIWLHYLTSSHLSLDDDLNGKGTFTWANVGVPPEGGEAAAQKLRTGTTSIIAGFLQIWNPFMNGGLLPAPQPSIAIAANDDGLQLHSTSANAVIDEQFDKNILLQQVHAVTPQADVTAFPTFTNTAEGKLVSTVRTVHRQPPTAPPAELTMSVTYTPVSGFQIPSHLHIDQQNGSVFDFYFKNCTVSLIPPIPFRP
jgi:hypothetical protein